MSTLSALSNDLASAAERASPAVVSVHGRQHVPSTGVLWQPNVVVTAEDAHALHGDSERCLEAGMDGYVSKPIRVEALVEAIHSVMRAHKA